MLNKPQTPTKDTKCGFVAIIGAPNAGKSTLVNELTGQKISIVTPKAQTTRNRIRGIRMYEQTQIIFIDTPGIFRIQGRLNNRLNQAIVQNAKAAFDGIDYIMFMFDSSKHITDDDMEVINLLKNQTTPKILVLNKVDIVDKEKLLALTMRLNEEVQFEQTFMISALKGSGVDDMLKFFAGVLPQGVYMYPEDEISDFPARLLAADITREKLFLHMREEIPYNTMVETEKYEETAKDIKIHQSIYTISETHKKMIIGKGAEGIKRIGEQSRRELTHMLGKKVSIFLHVKVRENWMDSKESYNVSGIDY